MGADPRLAPGAVGSDGGIGLPAGAELHRAGDSPVRLLSHAFIRRDLELARAIPGQDDNVDALYNQFYRVLLSHILSQPTSLEQATYLMWVAHNLERAADRVTNICERVAYTVTGKIEPQVLDKAPEASLMALV